MFNRARLIMMTALGYPMAWTRDFDGDSRLRRMKVSPFGDVLVGAILGFVCVNRDGSITSRSYITRWKPANHHAERLRAHWPVQYDTLTQAPLLPMDAVLASLGVRQQGRRSSVGAADTAAHEPAPSQD